ncbi:hypothetical protein HG535_0D02180 [Zygotorulaspora mrakii]|uniref:Conserved oligomeric Golgi complex subunit 6 n=1 Tax=Zygotorulaspora mrakii TaxID=42260 RepID=A0A7H9B1K6_ZYGMR|nr:uncharacterized protein HG535_0D02180 [Zygotorulaspora mrakii]QLG72510.1 hypothetical protein HG535_0D02180 [Zygotorulaspora mrakii]
MDFIDYESFAVIDQSSGEDATNSLPEPSSTLNISSFREESKTQQDEFKLPYFLNNGTADENGKKSSLYDKMAVYANLSIESLNLNEPKTSKKEQPVDTVPQFNEPTKAALPSSGISDFLSGKSSKTTDAANMVLSRKLSNVLTDYILTNYKSRTQLRKSLDFLEENEDQLPFDTEKLIDSGYIGTLARRSLRSDIENELLKEHLIVLEEFRPIVRRIKRFSSSVETIRVAGDDILKDNESVDEDEASVMNELTSLHTNLSSLRLKKSLLVSLQKLFSLTQVEDDVIFNGTVDLEFFRVADKVLSIKKHATYLLSLPDAKAGTSLINKLNNTLKSINNKVYNYLVDFIYHYESSSNYYGEKTLEVNTKKLNVFRKGLIYLTNDLEYFNEFLKKVTTVRSKIVLDEFLSVFDYDPKDSLPIAISAHDPLRYIGDVLASVHSSIANEADFVKSLFQFQVTQLEAGSETTKLQNEEYLDSLDVKLLNQIVQSLSNSCRIRIEQIVRFEENPVTNLEIVRLLKLYQIMFERKGINAQSSIISSLKMLEVLSKEKITNSFTKIIDGISAIGNENNDTMPPEWLADYISRLVEFFEAYERGKDSDSNENDALASASFLKKAVEDPIQNKLSKMIQNEFPTARKNEEVRSSLLTMQINCFDLIKSRLQPFSTTIFAQNEETSAIYQKITDKLQQFINRMLELQNKLLFENSGLELYYNLLNMIFPISSIQDELDYDMYLSLSDNALMELDTIMNKVHAKLTDYLPQALTDLQENLLFRLTSPSIADEISETCFENLFKFYINFRRILMHLYPDRKEKITSILNFTEEEFKTLIGLN